MPTSPFALLCFGDVMAAALMENGLLDRRESFDLLDNLDFGIMELGMSDEEPSDNVDVNVTVPTSKAAAVPALPALGGKASGGKGSAMAPPTVSPPVVAPAAAAATSEKAAGAAARVSPFRNSGKSEQEEEEGGGNAGVSVSSRKPAVTVPVPAPAASVGQGQGGGEKGSTKARGGGDGARGGGEEVDVSFPPVVVFAAIRW